MTDNLSNILTGSIWQVEKASSKGWKRIMLPLKDKHSTTGIKHDKTKGPIMER